MAQRFWRQSAHLPAPNWMNSHAPEQPCVLQGVFHMGLTALLWCTPVRPQISLVN